MTTCYLTCSLISHFLVSNLCSFSTDIDECQEHNGGCSQHCHNLVGGYQCTCDHGWSLSGDSKTCFGKCKMILI